MHQQCADTASSRKMFTSMGSRPIILFICLAISVVIARPYDDQQLAAAQGSDYSQSHGYRSIELKPITYRKHFHFFAAPEEDDTFDEEIPEELLKKDINVVVIRAPENNKATATIARLAKNLAEEKTAIYVLNKQPDLKEISAHIERFKDKKTIRPEVHFIKYKTAEEADLAARNIQIGYDALKGPSEVEHQLTAALHSYVGLLDDGGVQEMQLVSFYGRPRLEGSKGESLLSTSFYSPPGGESESAPVYSSGVESPASGAEDVASAGDIDLSSSIYLPPAEETSPASVRSDYGKRSASAPTETVTEGLKSEEVSSTANAVEDLATSTESSSSTTERSSSTVAATKKFATTASFTRLNKKLQRTTTTTERSASSTKTSDKKKTSRGRLRYSDSEKTKKDQQQ